MIFRPELIDKILRGEKTETRRKVKPGEPCRYVPGKSYALQPGRGEKSVGRIKIIRVQRELLRTLDYGCAVREGFENVQEFRDYWASLYGEYDGEQEVWVIEFRVSDRVAVYADE